MLLSGPRQSGKTTLLRRDHGSTHAYVSLENLDVRERAVADPVGFLRDHPPPVILDEIQHTPGLLSYIQTAIDEDRRSGQWLLSSSQSFPLMQGTSESLAGRVAVLNLLPLSFAELRRQPAARRSPEAALDRLFSATAAPRPRLGLARCLLRGGFPELWA